MTLFETHFKARHDEKEFTVFINASTKKEATEIAQSINSEFQQAFKFEIITNKASVPSKLKNKLSDLVIQLNNINTDIRKGDYVEILSKSIGTCRAKTFEELKAQKPEYNRIEQVGKISYENEGQNGETIEVVVIKGNYFLRSDVIKANKI